MTKRRGRRTVALSWTQRRELEQARERCAAVLKIADGASAHALARQGRLKPRDPDALYAWLDRYATEGLAGLTAHRHGGYCRSRLRLRGTRRPRAGGG